MIRTQAKRDRALRFHRARVDHATSLRGGLLASWYWILAELNKADPDAAGPAMTETKAHLVRVAEELNQRRGARPVPDRGGHGMNAAACGGEERLTCRDC